MKNRPLTFLLFLLLPALSLPADEPSGSGPLYSTSIYFPYILFAQLSGFPAAVAADGDVNLAGTLYLTNDMVMWSEKISGESYYHTTQDHENLTFEGNFSRGFGRGLEAGGTIRFLLYYGGFLDWVIEGFHGLFDFPNGGREFFDQNRVEINVENNNGLEIKQKGTLFALGETDLWLKTDLFSDGRNRLTGLVLVKVPTGALSGSSAVSTGYPDLLLAAMADFHPFRLFSFYFQTGFTLPGQHFNPAETARPYPHFSSLLAVEFHPSQRWGVIAQLNFKTAALGGDVKHWFFDNTDRLLLPQTDLLFGLVLTSDHDRWQLFFTENFLTNAGADITFGIRYSRTFRRNP
jgi:hypothetical protein